MEKMRPLDGKLKHQVDRMVKMSSMNPSEIKAMSLRANPAALMAQDDDDDDDDEREKDEADRYIKKSSGSKAGKDALYQVPKTTAALYKVYFFVLV